MLENWDYISHAVASAVRRFDSISKAKHYQDAKSKTRLDEVPILGLAKALKTNTIKITWRNGVAVHCLKSIKSRSQLNEESARLLEGKLKLVGTINEIVDLPSSIQLPLSSNQKNMVSEEENALIIEINVILGD